MISPISVDLINNNGPNRIMTTQESTREHSYLSSQLWEDDPSMIMSEINHFFSMKLIPLENGAAAYEIFSTHHHQEKQ